MRSEAGVSKAYVIVTLMICMSFIGCIEDDEEKDSATLKDSVYEFFDRGNTQNWRKWCSYILYTVEDNEIVLANNTELNECETEIENVSGIENGSESEYKYTISNYTEENLDYRATNNSGFVYSVSVTLEACERSDEFEPWDCDVPLDWNNVLWVEVGGQWVWWERLTFSDTDSSPPIARINPSNPKIQANETILFSASDSTDSDGDTLTFTWLFEGDSEQYNGDTIERTYPDEGDFYVVLLVTDSTGLTDEAETTVHVGKENYHGQASGDVDEGESDQIEFPVESGVVSLYITWELEDEKYNQQFTHSRVNLTLNDADGSELRREEGTEEGDGSWSFSSDELQSVGTYEFMIEGENGSMSYECYIDISY